jgi:hypothetical protein
MGDKRRFGEFSSLIAKTFSKNLSVADVAAGKGFLQVALREKGFKNIESIEKRPINNGRIEKSNWRYGYFDHNTAGDYDVIAAMHPDEATDHCIAYAGKRRKYAVICPCCAKASAFQYWGPNKYNNWISHLTNLAYSLNLDVEFKKLKINGRNDVLILRP